MLLGCVPPSSGHEDTEVPSPRRAPWLAPHPPIQPTSGWDAAGHTRTRPPSQTPSLPTLPALSKPSCHLLPFVPPAGARRRESYSPSTRSPSTRASQKLSRQRGLVKQKEGSSSCLQPCLPPPTSAGHPAQPAPSPTGAEPTCMGWDRPRGASIAWGLRRTASPSVSPPGPYPRAMESACSPRARRVSPAPAASAGLWGKRPRDALPSEEAWSHPGSREEAGDCSEHGSKICATNTRTLSHMFKPD